MREPNWLVILKLSTPDRFRESDLSPRLYQQIRDQNAVLEGFAAMRGPTMTLSGDGTAELVNGKLVSGNFFETLGVNPMLGRVLSPEDDRIPDGHPVCVIGFGLWQRRFGGEPGVIGRSVLPLFWACRWHC